MLERLAKRFGEEAAVAEQTWASAEAVAQAAPGTARRGRWCLPRCEAESPSFAYDAAVRCI